MYHTWVYDIEPERGSQETILHDFLMLLQVLLAEVLTAFAQLSF